MLLTRYFSSALKEVYARIVLAITKSDEFPDYSDLQKSVYVGVRWEWRWKNAFPNISGNSNTCRLVKYEGFFFNTHSWDSRDVAADHVNGTTGCFVVLWLDENVVMDFNVVGVILYDLQRAIRAEDLPLWYTNLQMFAG